MGRPKSGLSVTIDDRRKLYTHSPSSGSGVSRGLALVADNDVNVGKDFLELDLEELRDEWCAQVDHDSLSSARSSLGDLED